MPKTDPDSNPSGSQPKPTEVAPPVVPTKPTTRGAAQKETKKAQREAAKLLQAQQKEERAKVKAQADKDASESALIAAGMIKIEEDIKKDSRSE